MWKLVPKYCMIARLRAKPRVKQIQCEGFSIRSVRSFTMVYCSVACCKNGNHNRKDLSYFIFPTDKRLSKWLKFCRRADRKFADEATKAKDGQKNNLRICSDHFHPSAYRKTLNGIRKTNDTALPTIFQPIEERTPRSERYETVTKKRRLDVEAHVNDTHNIKRCLSVDLNGIEVENSAAANDVSWDFGDFHDVQHDHSYSLLETNSKHPHGELQESEESEPVFKSVSCQTEMSMLDIERLQRELESVQNKLSEKVRLKRDLFMEDVLKDDDSVKFYTGIPTLGCFNMLVGLITPEAKKLKYWDKNKDKKLKYQTTENSKPGPKRNLTVNEEIVMSLVRLRLGLMGRHLADLFLISQSQVSRIFTTWTCFLSSVLKESLVLWPEKEEIKQHLPRSFKKYPNTRIIIDCTEVFIEKPTAPYAQRATWSEYKGHNTIKALVGITPSGYFSFLSKFWTGSTSDRKITQESGLVDLLEEGDSVMADRGFNIRDMLTKKKVYLNIPPFSKKGNIICLSNLQSCIKPLSQGSLELEVFLSSPHSHKSIIY